MTEERKQELRQLLAQAKESLVIRCVYGGPSIPVDAYKNYLQERWTYYGIDFLSFASSLYFAPDIANGTTKSNLLNYILKFVQFALGSSSLIKGLLNIVRVRIIVFCLRK